MNNAKFCNKCGTSLNPDAHFCTQCGAKTNEVDEPVVCEKNITPEVQSPKSAVTALLLCLFLGTVGVHRFYVGKIGTGILMLFTGGGFGIWTLIDIIRIACCEFKDKQDRPLIFTGGRTSPSKVKWIVGSVFAAIILFVMMIVAIAFYATSGETELVREQLSAIRAGDLKKAYSYTAKDFQNEVSFDRFQRFVNQYPSLKNNKTSSFTERKIQNGRGTIKGTLQSTDGKTVPVEYNLIKEGANWKILVIHILPTEAETSSDQSSITP